MGVVKSGFSSDYRGYKNYRIIKKEKIVRVNSTPDPTKFEIIKKININGYPIFMVRYEDVQNYEGVKILMYSKDFNTNLLEKRMDPHFFDQGDSPIARFEPTEYGWNLAKKLAMNS